MNRRFWRMHAKVQLTVQTIWGSVCVFGLETFPYVSATMVGASAVYLGISYPREYLQKKREAAREAREQSRQVIEELKRTRRDARDSLAYEVLAHYVVFENNPEMGADRGYEPLVSIDLDQLTDSQTDILDAYLESAYDMMAIWTGDLVLNKDHVTNSGLNMIHQFAIEAASLLLVDSNMRQMRDHQAKFT